MGKQLALQDQPRSASRLAARTDTHARLWWNLAGMPARAKHRDAISEYWEMFRFSEQAHLISFVVGAHALHHDRNGTVNFHSLSEELGGVALAAITQGLPVHKKVEILRHQAFAHRGSKRTYDDVFAAAKISGDEITRHAALTLAIANELLRAGGLVEEFASDLPERTVDRMLSDLARNQPT